MEFIEGIPFGYKIIYLIGILAVLGKIFKIIINNRYVDNYKKLTAKEKRETIRIHSKALKEMKLVLILLLIIIGVEIIYLKFSSFLFIENELPFLVEYLKGPYYLILTIGAFLIFLLDYIQRRLFLSKA
jgi:hypothetical protein